MSVYKRGSKYWYKFRWTIKQPDGGSENFVIRKPARTGSRKKARKVEDEHRRALRLGQIHSADPWPAPKPQAPQVPTVREFIEQFFSFVKTQKKAGTRRFHGICTNRILRFQPLADAVLTDVTSELISKYAQWRGSTSATESILTVNGDLRTVRRMLRIAHERD